MEQCANTAAQFADALCRRLETCEKSARQPMEFDRALLFGVRLWRGALMDVSSPEGLRRVYRARVVQPVQRAGQSYDEVEAEFMEIEQRWWGTVTLTQSSGRARHHVSRLSVIRKGLETARMHERVLQCFCATFT